MGKGPRSREVGAEPIPGYRLIEPLGKGGFGEVWKCEAPGGLFKAIKFVSNENQNHAVTLEWEALKRVKLIRHPFILSLDRVELVDGELLVVMELADHNLYWLHQAYRRRGHPGLPRDLLLGFLLEAAEALDWMNFEHQLQHLDIKPHNLFIVSNHLKVADFGLVQQVSEGTSESRRLGGVTPLYASPELLRGGFSRTSDQYSLAVVYQQMLTGDVPFWDENLYQLVLLHLTGEPQLDSLPEADRPVLTRALARTPENRYPSCLEFVQALLPAAAPGSVSRSGVRRLPGGAAAEQPLVGFPDLPDSPSANQPTQMVSPDAKTGRQSGSAGTHPMEAVDKLLSEESGRSSPSGLIDPAVSLASCWPGSRFLNCLSQGPLGDLWQVEDGEGREKRALALLPTPEPARLVARLKALTHPALLPIEVVEAPGERVVLFFDPSELTLRDRFEQCQAEGQPGIPREELLGHLKRVAAALDTIGQQHGIPHLGLNPHCLIYREKRGVEPGEWRGKTREEAPEQPSDPSVESSLPASGEVFLADLGLIHLVGIRAGLQPVALNPRYAPPELYNRPASQTSDQYSLALIYAELLTGNHPRPFRPGSGMSLRPTSRGGRSGTVPRPDSSARRSGAGPRPDSNARRSGQTPRPNQGEGARARPIHLELDLLPQPDRDIVTRALDTDPEARFPSCTAFMQALEAATARPNTPAVAYHELPPLIPFTTLQGEPPPRGLVLPRVGQLIRELATPAPHQLLAGPQNTRYKVHPDGTWEHQFPVHLLPGALLIKLDGFRLQWDARIVQQEADRFVFHLDLTSTSFWDRKFTRPRRLEIEVIVASLPSTGSRMTEARVYLRLTGAEPAMRDEFLERMGPQFCESLRSFLQARQEQRGDQRQLFSRLLHVYPIRPDLELGEVLAGVGVNISSGGLGFRVPRLPESEWFYLHFPEVPTVAGFALLGQILRATPAGEGGHEVAARLVGT